MPIPAQYDFGAADRLASLLAVLGDRLGELAARRSGERNAGLGDPAASGAAGAAGAARPVVWTGGRRRIYEDEFRSEQAELARLAETAQRLRYRVLAATAEAVRLGAAGRQD